MKQTQKQKPVSEKMKWTISSDLHKHILKSDFKWHQDKRAIGIICGAVRDVIDKINNELVKGETNAGI